MAQSSLADNRHLHHSFHDRLDRGSDVLGILFMTTPWPKRKRNRLQDYDYSGGGWYFITICVKNREELFGKIENGEMILNEHGKIATQQWQWLANQYDYLTLEEFVVMPNHIHGIMLIDPDRCSDKSRPVATDSQNKRPVATSANLTAKKIKSLSELIGAFKTTSSKLIHRGGLKDFSWQRSFYDHIIRDEKDFANIIEYIQNNPLQWAFDRNKMENVYY